MRFALCIGLTFLLPLLAAADSARYNVVNSFKVRAAEGGQELELAPGQKFMIVEMGRREARLQVFGADGNALPGEFVISASDLEKVRAGDMASILEAVQAGAAKKHCPTCQIEGDAKKEPAPAAKKPDPLVVPVFEREPLPKQDAVPTGNKWCDIYAKFKGKVPDAPLRQAMLYLSQEPNHKDKRQMAVSSRAIKKQRYLSISDFSQQSSKERFYLLDTETGEVRQEKVAHGAGGSREKLENCGGIGSNMTRAGFYRVDDLYYSEKGSWRGWGSLGGGKNGIRLQGLTPGNNWHDLSSGGVVMHEGPRYITAKVGDSSGRSNGCPGFAEGRPKAMKEKLTGGTLFYSYAPVCKSQHKNVLSQVNGWEKFCK